MPRMFFRGCRCGEELTREAFLCCRPLGAIGEPATRRGDQPCFRTLRDAVARPPLERRGEGVSKGVLGTGEVARAPR